MSDVVPPPPRSKAALLVPPLAAMALAGLASAAALWAAGPTHGVLFGACVVAALLTPSLAADRSPGRAILSTAGVALGCGVGPAIAVLSGQLPADLGATGAVVAAAVAAAAGGSAALLAAARLPAGVASLLVTLVLIAWLGWPVWLSPHLAGQEARVATLSAAHPLLTIDAAVVRAGGVTWAQHKVMYAKLTTLGQHVLPRPPATAAATLILHFATGVVGFGLAWGLRRLTSRGAASGTGVP